MALVQFFYKINLANLIIIPAHVTLYICSFKMVAVNIIVLSFWAVTELYTTRCACTTNWLQLMFPAVHTYMMGLGFSCNHIRNCIQH